MVCLFVLERLEKFRSNKKDEDRKQLFLKTTLYYSCNKNFVEIACKMSTAFGTYGPTSAGSQPSSSTGSSASSSSSSSSFNWMAAIANLQNEIKYESFKKKYPIYTIQEETHDQMKKMHK